MLVKVYTVNIFCCGQNNQITSGANVWINIYINKDAKYKKYQEQPGNEFDFTHSEYYITMWVLS